MSNQNMQPPDAMKRARQALSDYFGPQKRELSDCVTTLADERDHARERLGQMTADYNDLYARGMRLDEQQSARIAELEAERSTCPDCGMVYIDHDGFGFCGCKEAARIDADQRGKIAAVEQKHAALVEAVDSFLHCESDAMFFDLDEDPETGEVRNGDEGNRVQLKLDDARKSMRALAQQDQSAGELNNNDEQNNEREALQLYEITAIVTRSAVVCAISEEDALDEVADWDHAWEHNSDRIGVSDVELMDVRKMKTDDPKHESHVVTLRASQLFNQDR